MVIGTVIALIGEEEFLKEERLKAIKKYIVGTEREHPDYNLYRAGENGIRTIIDTARSMPFGLKKRLVIVKEIEKLKPDELHILIEYIKHPVVTACLVLITSQRNLHKDLEQAVLKYAKKESFELLKGERLFRWVKARFTVYGKSVSHYVASLMIDRLGADLHSLSSAIEKLSLYVGKRNFVEQKDVETLIGIDRKTSAFEFINAVVDEDFPRALRVVLSLLREGTTAQELLGLIGWQMNQFAQVIRLLDERLIPVDIARRLNIPMFKIDTIVNKVKSLELNDIERLLESILHSDLSIKTGRQKPQEALELLTLKLCHS